MTDVVNIGFVLSLCPLVHLTSSILHGGFTSAVQSSTVSPSLCPCTDRDVLGKIRIKRQYEMSSSISKILYRKIIQEKFKGGKGRKYDGGAS